MHASSSRRFALLLVFGPDCSDHGGTATTATSSGTASTTGDTCSWPAP